MKFRGEPPSMLRIAGLHSLGLRKPKADPIFILWPPELALLIYILSHRDWKIVLAAGGEKVDS